MGRAEEVGGRTPVSRNVTTLSPTLTPRQRFFFLLVASTQRPRSSLCWKLCVHPLHKYATNEGLRAIVQHLEGGGAVRDRRQRQLPVRFRSKIEGRCPLLFPHWHSESSALAMQHPEARTPDGIRQLVAPSIVAPSVVPDYPHYRVVGVVMSSMHMGPPTGWARVRPSCHWHWQCQCQWHCPMPLELRHLEQGPLGAGIEGTI